MKQMMMFRFERDGVDEWNDKKTKVISYRIVYVCEYSKEAAIKKANLDERYSHTATYSLGKDWR